MSEVLEEMNDEPSTDPDLPPKGIKCAIEYLLDPVHFMGNQNLDYSMAMRAVNTLLSSEGLYVTKDLILPQDLFEPQPFHN